MKSLQELRLVTKAEKLGEDTLAAIIMILKSPAADITWQKGAIRQLANLYRFIKETQLFHKINLTEEYINFISIIIDNVQLENTSLYKWIKRVLQYHTVLLKKVRPIHEKYKEIEEDEKLILLDNKSQALEARLKDHLQQDREMTIVFDQILSIKDQIINWQLDPIKENSLQIIDRQKPFSGPDNIVKCYFL
ncbi:unnamed protein product [Adineta steineri]|uniref:Uncharacterized protein n=1 Tax=Adineta steineri TaxID=433720 RepID=A0A813NYS3_9BILA|nr:unnamed protein product [Adineta steineri]CAF0737433.1 unnamed protein product [Adineta steineri]CAF0747164.1 unnamed protein product [Adineta steineri]